MIEYRKEELGYAEDYLCLALSSRKNLCIHPEIAARPIPGDTAPLSSNREMKNSTEVDSRCRDITSSWAREDPTIPKCDWYEQFESTGKSVYLKGVYSLDDLRNFGAKKDWWVLHKSNYYTKANIFIILKGVLIF